MRARCLVPLCLLACTDPLSDPYAGEAVKDDSKADASELAVFVDATWQGRLLTTASWNDEATVEAQLFYTVGQLNGMKSVGRIDKAEITDIVKTMVDGRIQITYTAKLLVAWGKRDAIPETIPLQLPLDVSSAGQSAFASKYGGACVDYSAPAITSGNMFYYYRPARSGCTIDPVDVHVADAVVTPSPVQTTGKFPEYHKVWEDGRLEVVAIFGKYKSGVSSNSDAGISAYNRFANARSRPSSRPTPWSRSRRPCRPARASACPTSSTRRPSPTASSSASRRCSPTTFARR